MTRALMWVVGGVAAFGALGAGFVWSFRTKFAPVQDRIRRLNRRVTNPRVLASAGQPGAYASVVHHLGRRSGAAYRTPVVAVPADDGFVVALPYGPDADWVRNVRAAGAATIAHEGETVAVERPELLPAEVGNAHFPAKEQRSHRRFGVDDFLLLHRSATASTPDP